MSCIIAMSGADDEIYAVYCRNESDSSLILPMLKENYNSADKVAELINNGEISSITISVNKMFNNLQIYNTFSYFETDFNKRNILYYDDIENMVEENKDIIFYWNDNLEDWTVFYPNMR